jgi:ubiquinone/menaquinone biosynthesis C-methylase UbiE
MRNSNGRPLRQVFSTASLRKLYQRHPLNAKSILARVRRERTGNIRLTEEDLARDLTTQLTDQNHIGGADFVIALAERSGVSKYTKILDLGSGLGGSARLLASRWHCNVRGIDLSDKRCKDAKELTELVNLQHLVTFSRADFMRVRVPVAEFDVLWGQDSWSHVKWKKKFLARWLPALKPKGRVALQDVILRRRPTKKSEILLLRRLTRTWRSYVIPVQEWIAILRENSCRITCCEELSFEMSGYFTQMLRAANQIEGYSRLERNTFSIALKLLTKGILGYTRIVGVKSPR